MEFSQETYVDAEGLTIDGASPEYVEAIGLSKGRLITNRMSLLRRLQEGAGVTVVTGPHGAPFWSLVSPEVTVLIEPDGYEYETRVNDETEWSLLSVWADFALTRAWLTKPPTERHGQWGKWEAAAQLRVDLHSGPAVSPIVDRQWSTELVTDESEQQRLLAAIERDSEWVALDWEWTVPEKVPLGMAVSTADRNWYLTDTPSLTEAFTRILRGGKVNSILHNAKADISTAYRGDPLELVGKKVYDTLVMGYVTGDRELGLKAQARARLGRNPMDYPGDLENLDLGLVSRYAGSDTRNTFDLFGVLRKELEAKNQWSVYTGIEQATTPIVASMEMGGTPVDPVALARLRAEYVKEEDDLIAQAGVDLSVDANQLEFAKANLGYHPGNLKKENISKYQGSWADTLLRYRQVRHRRRAFVDKHLSRWEKAGKPDILWAYSGFNQAGEALPGDARGFKSAPRTGRFSSSGDFGNFQNQPRDIREIFVPPPGHDWFSFDYSGLELHIGAALSKDPEMMRVLGAPDGDLHQAFLDAIIRLTGVDVGRPVAKQGNFEQMYGGGAATLRVILAMTRAFIDHETAQQVVDAHKVTFAGYHGYGEQVKMLAHANGGKAYTLFGRERDEAEDIFGSDPSAKQWAERALLNMTIQGTAADILKMAMVRLVPVMNHFGAHMALQVHDEVAGWVSKDAGPGFHAAVKAVMESIEIPGLALKVEGKIGANWGETK